MRTYALIVSILLAALPASVHAQEAPRRGAPVPARATREAAEARRAAVRNPVPARASRTSVDVVAPPPPKRPRGS